MMPRGPSGARGLPQQVDIDLLARLLAYMPLMER